MNLSWLDTAFGYHGMKRYFARFMSDTTEEKLGINSWLEDELYQQYLNNHGTVDESWQEIFKATNGHDTAQAAPEQPSIKSEETAPQPEPAPIAAPAESAPVVAAPTAPAQESAVRVRTPAPVSVGAGEQLVPAYAQLTRTELRRVVRIFSHTRRNDLQVLAAKMGVRSGPRLKPAQAIVNLLRAAAEIHQPVFFFQNGRQSGQRIVLRNRCHGSLLQFFQRFH